MTPQSSVFVEVLGWAAAATFAASYFAKRSETLVRVQIAGALMWAGYGVLLRSVPVVAANVLVIAAATWKARASRVRDASSSRGSADQPAATPSGP